PGRRPALSAGPRPFPPGPVTTWPARRGPRGRPAARRVPPASGPACGPGFRRSAPGARPWSPGLPRSPDPLRGWGLLLIWDLSRGRDLRPGPPQHAGKRREERAGLAAAEDQRRGEPDGVRLHGVDQEARVAAGRLHRPGGGPGEHRGEPQALAADP